MREDVLLGHSRDQGSGRLHDEDARGVLHGDWGVDAELPVQQRVRHRLADRPLREVGDLELRPVGQVERGHVAARPRQGDQLVEYDDERAAQPLDDGGFARWGCPMLVDDPRSRVLPITEQRRARPQKPVLVVDHAEAPQEFDVGAGGERGRWPAALAEPTASRIECFAELGAERSAAIEAVSLDLGPAYIKSVTAEGHAPQAIVCADSFHLVKLVGDALDEVRRELWQQLRRLPDRWWAKDFKGARWALLKNPEDLTDRQADQLERIRRNRGGIWRAYEMKEQFRAIFAGDLTRDEAAVLLDRWCARAQRSRLAPFVKCARTMRHRRDLILNTIEHGISNSRVEGLNTKVRLIVRRAYGFHSADAALALVMLGAGPIDLQLPQEHKPAPISA